MSAAVPLTLSAGAVRATDPLRVRPAGPDDVDAVARLIAYWHAAGENLPRTREEIAGEVDRYLLAVRGRAVVGCGGIVAYRQDLAEIRSVGVDPASHGGGIGRRLVEALVERAAEQGYRTIFVLTRVPRFFARLGFTEIAMEQLPEKVFKDCERCPRRHCCDEIPMLIRPAPR